MSTARIERVMLQFNCSVDDARIYLEHRDEGYSAYQAKIMAGLADPPDPDPEDDEEDLEWADQRSIDALSETIEVYNDRVVTTPAPLDLEVTPEEDEAFNSMHGELR